MIQWFLNSWIQTRNSWIRTHNLLIRTLNSWIRTRNSWIWTCNWWVWISTRAFKFQLVLLSSQFVTRNSSLATHNLWLITRVLPYHPVASAVFWTTHLEAVFTASIPVFVAVSINFLTIFIAKFSCKGQKAVSFNVFSKFWFCWTSPLCNVTQ